MKIKWFTLLYKLWKWPGNRHITILHIRCVSNSLLTILGANGPITHLEKMEKEIAARHFLHPLSEALVLVINLNDKFLTYKIAEREI